ncbi:MAG: substrate-binding domain-containing protein [Elainellaceae cyanobacterium]
MTKLVVLKVGSGSFAQGFPVTLQIGSEGKLPEVEKTGTLPAEPDLPHLYARWQTVYSQLGGTRIHVPPQTTNVSYLTTCETAAQALEQSLERWFNRIEIRDLKECIQEEIHRDEDARIVLQTRDDILQRLPWHLWSLIAKRPNLELILSSEYGPPCPPLNRPVRILAILGNSDGINPQKDWEALKQLPNATFTLLQQPRRQDLNEALWQQPWDILFFAGHGSHAATGGEIFINETESLSLSQLQYALKAAVGSGLKLAIFNSCSGLGLVPALMDVGLPQMIVMREPVPDSVAQTFLRYFLAAFSQGDSLSLSVRKAREQLQGLEGDFPCASWLPIVCRNPAEPTLTWPQLQRKPYARPIGVAIASLIAGTAAATALAVVWSSDAPPAACFAHVANVPRGLFNHGGSTTWAKIRENLASSSLSSAFPEYELEYTHPTADEGNPGSHTGIKMLLSDRLSFAATSRPLRDSERDAAAEQGFKLVQTPVALDINVFVVHPTLDIPGLALSQIRDIYTGNIRNWQAVGGPDRPITTYAHRSAKTGWFKDVVLGDASHHEDTVWVDTTEGIQAVAADPGGIYDATAGQTVPQCTVRPIPVSDTSTEQFVSPYAGSLTFGEDCIETPRQLNQPAFRSSYPFTRNLYVVYKDFRGEDRPDERAGKAFVNLLLSDEGQRLVERSGFVPIRSEATRACASGN